MKWVNNVRIVKERKSIGNIKKEKLIIFEGILDLMGEEELMIKSLKLSEI